MRAHRCLRGASPFIAAVFAVALLGACNFPDEGTPEPGCDPSLLIAPGIPIEDSQISDSLRPTVEWVYDGTCEPDRFRIEFAPGGDFGSPQAVVGSTDAGVTTWSPSTDLLPVTEYAWHVAPISGSNTGPYSVTHAFWTGPVCDSPDLWPPTLLSPDTGAWVTEPSPDLEWAYPETECLQTSYKFEVSTDPGFSAAVIRGQTGPRPGFDTNLDFLIDCHTYFWRVAATWGDDIVGPYAGDFFHTQFGDTCAGQMDLAVVSGTLWSDVCPASGVCSGSPPAGCECIEGAIAADGVRQEGEAGIPSVSVRFGTGPCPASGWSAEAGLTDADGAYYTWLPAGIYCFWIDDHEAGNDAILQPGWWTHPIPYDTPFGHTVTVLEGGERAGADFAWQLAPAGAVRGGIGGQLWSDLDADGVLDDGEPGIDGVEVWLSSGACDPAWSNRAGGLDPTTRTNAQGRFGLGSETIDAYQWDSLPAGDYCVVVDPNDGYFDEIMGEGAWTYPVPDAEIAMTTVQVQNGQGRANVDFGWAATIRIAGQPEITASQNLNCRFGPATVYDVIGYLTAGETAAIIGRNSPSTWVQIQNPDRAGGCWVAVSGGTVAGDLSTVAVVAAPPTPTPAPTAVATGTPTPTPVDNQPPTVQVSHSPAAIFEFITPVVFTATASDNVGVTRIRIYVQGPGEASPTLVQTCNNTTTCTYTGGPYSGNPWSYFATAGDAAHNLGTSGTMTFWVAAT
jgi:hypothetical protein